jgi:hypothetical protein
MVRVWSEISQSSSSTGFGGATVPVIVPSEKESDHVTVTCWIW